MSRRRKPWQAPPDQPRCPHNGKLCYQTMESAEYMLAQALIHGSPYQVPRRVYLCECGAWHLTKQENREHPVN